MVQHIWTVPCRLSTVDRESNNASLIEALEELTIPTVLPQQPDRALIPAIFDVVTLWGRENDERAESGFGRMTLVSPSGEPLLVNEYDIGLRESRRFRLVGRILGFPAQNSGRYHFRVERRQGDNAEWHQVATVPLWVNILRQENRPEQNGGAQ
jgi:hypothetical protein